MTTPKFDRRPEFDPKSRDYPIRTLVPPTFRSYTWQPYARLDQGTEGACVGFGWSHELSARPVPVAGITNTTARNLYRRAKLVDQWPGTDYSGTSVLAGAKVVLADQMITEYRWAFGLDDLRRAVGYKGPAVLGLNWYEGMMRPDSAGYIRPTGAMVGGHCIMVYSVSETERIFRLLNSWGTGWGFNGACRMTFADMARLLGEDGEACIPVGRST